MNINTAAPRKSYQPDFTGYVDKPVRKIIDRACKNDAKHITSYASQRVEETNPEELSQLKNLHKRVLEKLDTFMKRLRPETTLTLSEDKFIFKNTKLNKNLKIESYYSDRASGRIYDMGKKTLDLHNPAKDMWSDGTDLVKIERFADELMSKVDPKAIDNAIYAQFTKGIKEQAADTSLWGLFTIKRNIKKAAKISPEYGDKTNWKDKLTSIRNELIEFTNKQSRISKENNKKYKNFLDEMK